MCRSGPLYTLDTKVTMVQGDVPGTRDSTLIEVGERVPELGLDTVDFGGTATTTSTFGRVPKRKVIL